jgi:hypothetical protein
MFGSNAEFLEVCDIVPAFVPADINTDADGDWVNLSHYARCLVLLVKAAGTAGDDPSIKLQQATSAAGAGAKDLQFTKIRHKIGTLSSVGTWTISAVAATADLDLATPTDFASDDKQAMFAVDVKASDLDVSNGFKFIQLSIEGDDIGNTQLACGLYILYGNRYPQSVPLSAIA